MNKDNDNITELGDDFFEKADSPENVLGKEASSKLPKPKKVGRPVAENPKISTTMRLDADVLNGYRNLGKGWQTKVNQILKEQLPAAQAANKHSAAGE